MFECLNNIDVQVLWGDLLLESVSVIEAVRN